MSELKEGDKLLGVSVSGPGYLAEPWEDGPDVCGLFKKARRMRL